MSNFSWSDIINNNKNSIVHINSTTKVYDCTKPYVVNNNQEINGTGFIVDIAQGIIVTNYNVVKNAVSISGFIPILIKESLRLEIVSVCPLYELALIRICEKDLKELIYVAIEDPTVLNLEFDDSMYVKEGDQIISIGYDQENDNIQPKSSNIVDTIIVKKFDYDMQYVKISESLSKSNLGSPIFNTNGKVIGIFSNNYYCIPSRLLLCVYASMNSEKTIFTPPIHGLTYGHVNQDFINNKTNSNTDEAIITGVYVRNVSKTSFLDHIDKGNIISAITYQDPFIARDKIVSLKHEFFVKCNGHVESELRNLLGNYFEEFKNSKGETFPDILNVLDKDSVFPSITITAHINNYGYIQLYELGFEEISDKLEAVNTDTVVLPIIDKKFKLEELFFMLNIETALDMKVFHLDYKGQSGWFENTATFSSENTCTLDNIDYTFNNPKFELVAGCCFTSLNLDLNEKFKVIGNKHNVIISQIFQNSSIYKVGDFKPGDVVISINNREIKNTNDIRIAMKNCPVYFNMKTKNDKEFICAREEMLIEDLEIIKLYKIQDYVHPLSERDDDRIIDPGRLIKQLRKLK